MSVVSEPPTDGWLNFDNSPSVRFAHSRLILSLLMAARLASEESLKFGAAAREKGIRWADACKRIPSPDQSLDMVYSSHVLEHLDLQEAERFLGKIHRVLRPGGIVRLAVPDLNRRVEKYVRDGDADEFMESLNMRAHNLRSLSGKIPVLILVDRDHRWMYDGRFLVRALQKLRFVDVRQMSPGETMVSDPGPLNLRELEEEAYMSKRGGNDMMAKYIAFSGSRIRNRPLPAAERVGRPYWRL